ncbi:hypothetical protein VF21_03018 [Pseudogymnoascus sp. 05NY08]|nr:hypothetical protein VF21_03018 [Pseudogymnoascus sp. 05NY08]
MDPLSISAGAIAVITAAISSFKTIRTLCIVPKEVEELASELRRLSNIANDISPLLPELRESTNLIEDLKKATEKIEEVQAYLTKCVKYATLANSNVRNDVQLAEAASNSQDGELSMIRPQQSNTFTPVDAKLSKRSRLKWTWDRKKVSKFKTDIQKINVRMTASINISTLNSSTLRPGEAARGIITAIDQLHSVSLDIKIESTSTKSIIERRLDSHALETAKITDWIDSSPLFLEREFERLRHELMQELRAEIQKEMALQGNQLLGAITAEISNRKLGSVYESELFTNDVAEEEDRANSEHGGTPASSGSSALMVTPPTDIIDSLGEYASGLSIETMSTFYSCLSEVTSHGPDSFFECSSTFFPEVYSVEGFYSTRIAVLSVLTFNGPNATKINKYFLLYAQTPRKWCRVTISMYIENNPRQREITQELGRQGLDSTLKHLPTPLHNEFESFLPTIQFYDSVTSVSVYLEDHGNSHVTFNQDEATITEDEQEKPTTRPEDFVCSIEDLGCPQFLESEVVVLRHMLSSLFLVRVEGKECLEKKKPFSTPGKPYDDGVEIFYKELQALYCVRESKRVLDFIGVVLDDTRNQVKSYIYEYAKKGPLCHLMEMTKPQDVPIPWARRQKWARQIVEGVADIHAQGLVVGSLTQGACICVDENDNAKLVPWPTAARFDFDGKGYLPPELRLQQGSDTFINPLLRGSRLDLFQLGLLLWLIAEHEPNWWTGAFCSRIGCKFQPRYSCETSPYPPTSDKSSTFAVLLILGIECQLRGY